MRHQAICKHHLCLGRQERGHGLDGHAERGDCGVARLHRHQPVQRQPDHPQQTPQARLCHTPSTRVTFAGSTSFTSLGSITSATTLIIITTIAHIITITTPSSPYNAAS
jgi:hypothetical protein